MEPESHLKASCQLEIKVENVIYVWTVSCFILFVLVRGATRHLITASQGHFRCANRFS